VDEGIGVSARQGGRVKVAVATGVRERGDKVCRNGRKLAAGAQQQDEKSDEQVFGLQHVQFSQWDRCSGRGMVDENSRSNSLALSACYKNISHLSTAMCLGKI
jgi:hypothetical protein